MKADEITAYIVNEYKVLSTCIKNYKGQEIFIESMKKDFTV